MMSYFCDGNLLFIITTEAIVSPKKAPCPVKQKKIQQADIIHLVETLNLSRAVFKVAVRIFDLILAFVDQIEHKHFKE